MARKTDLTPLFPSTKDESEAKAPPRPIDPVMPEPGVKEDEEEAAALRNEAGAMFVCPDNSLKNIDVIPMTGVSTRTERDAGGAFVAH